MLRSFLFEQRKKVLPQQVILQLAVWAVNRVVSSSSTNETLIFNRLW